MTSHRSMWRAARWVLVVTALAGVVPRVGAQGGGSSGTISGRVIDRTTQQPIQGAQVLLVGTQRGIVVGDDGRYRLGNVPAGAHEVRVVRIGYQAATQSVTVPAGGTATADFALVAAAVQLDAVVTTATGETQRRRETGNTVATVQPAAEQLATAVTVADVLQGKAPGVYVNQSGGTQGGANRIRIRGATSVSLSNEPLLIVDGVRANNDIAGTGTIGVGGQQSSRLNDLNPDDIESIEVIKGPAAAALYGTAAANGVIQIKTKRGRSGAPRWTVYTEGGSQKDVIDYPANFTQVGTNTSGARITGCTLDQQTRALCVPRADSLVSFNPLVAHSPFRTGYKTTYGVNIAGGGDVANYFISGDYDRDQGIYDPNKFRRASGRANINAQVRSNAQAQLSTSFMSSRLQFPQNDNDVLGVVSSGLLGSAFDDPVSHGYLAGQDPRDIFNIRTEENVERFIGSGNGSWQPFHWLNVVGTGGVDYFDRRNNETLGPNLVFFGSDAEGYRQRNSAQIWSYTGTTNATATFMLRPGLQSTSTAGVQYNEDMVNGERAFGAKLLAGTGSLQGASARFSVGETNTDNKTLGGLVQEQLAWRDRLFVTGALRTDKNSAFGKNFGWIKYPAASLSYVISDEGFFPRNNVLTSLRLRTAYGESGRQPSFRDAITFFNAQTVTVSGTDVPGIQVGGTGNIDLKPELTREVEGGFEAGFFNSRLGVEFTYYDKRTKDLLIARPLPPSLGLSTTQFANLGASSNKGLELQLNAQLLNMRNAKFDVTVNGSTNSNKLLDIGKLPTGQPVPPIVVNSIQKHVQGYPLGGYWGRQVTFQDLNNDGVISRANCPGQTQVPNGPACEITLTDTAVYLGNPLPRRELSVLPKIQLFGWLSATAVVDYKGKFKLFNNTARFRCNFGNCQEAYDKAAPLADQARNLGQLMGTDAGYVEDATFTKLREVAVTLTAPKSLASRAHVSGLSLTLAGRNLHTWTNYSGFDPEVNSTPTANFSTSDFLTQPPLRIYTARLTVQF